MLKAKHISQPGCSFEESKSGCSETIERMGLAISVPPGLNPVASQSSGVGTAYVADPGEEPQNQPAVICHGEL